MYKIRDLATSEPPSGHKSLRRLPVLRRERNAMLKCDNAIQQKKNEKLIIL